MKKYLQINITEIEDNCRGERQQVETETNRNKLGN